MHCAKLRSLTLRTAVLYKYFTLLKTFFKVTYGVLFCFFLIVKKQSYRYVISRTLDIRFVLYITKKITNVLYRQFLRSKIFGKHTNPTDTAICYIERSVTDSRYRPVVLSHHPPLFASNHICSQWHYQCKGTGLITLYEDINICLFNLWWQIQKDLFNCCILFTVLKFYKWQGHTKLNLFAVRKGYVNL